MKNSLWIGMFFACSSLLACGGGLKNPITPAACDPIVQAAIDSKCTGADKVTLTCVGLTKSTAKMFESSDVNVCAANISAAADCTHAKAVTCSISFTE